MDYLTHGFKTQAQRPTASAPAPAAIAQTVLEPRLPLGQIILLAALTALLATSIEGFSPAMPAIANALATDAAHISAAISAFVISFAIAQLIAGSLADALGRRPVVLVGLGIFIAGSLMSAFASSFMLLLLARVVQGIGAAAAVLLARTIVRDQLPREAAARALALIGIFFSMTPILAPMIAAVLIVLGGWRAPLFAMALMGSVIWIISLRRLPETLPPQKRLPFDAMDLLRSLGNLLRSRTLMAYVVANALSYSGILLFSAAAPQVMIGTLAASTVAYAMLFGMSSIGFLGGNALSFRLVKTRGVDATLRFGTSFLLIGPFLILAISWFWPNAWPAMVLAHSIYMFGWGVVQPQAQAGALSAHPEAIGQASSLIGFIQLAIGGAIVGLFAAVTNGAPASLGVAMLLCGAAASVWANISIRPGGINARHIS